MSPSFVPTVFSLPSTQALIELALAEDSSGGDVASDCLFSSDTQSDAVVIARHDLVVCGLPIISEIIKSAHSAIEVDIVKEEGVRAVDQEVLAKLSGPTAEILRLERVILNFIQRLSGIATTTNDWVRSAPKLTILDTRKTLPGYRYLDKYATRVGGAKNHRMNLSSMAMIKNNHVDVGAQKIGAIVKRVRANAPLATPVEVEVRDMRELSQAITAQPEVIMLDNMTDVEIAQSLKLIRKKRCPSIVEISGGITKQRLPILQRLGVTHVSVGALTHSVIAADISLRIK